MVKAKKIKVIEPQTKTINLPKPDEPIEFEDIAIKVGRIRKALNENLDKQADSKDINKTYKNHIDDFLQAKKNGRAIA